MSERPTWARLATSRAAAHALALVALTSSGPLANGQGFSPAEAARRMSLPGGLAVRTVAAEPMVRQPVCIEFDDRGRLWVIQYLQYPNPAGLKRVKVDRYSRTLYDAVPQPPPRGPKGADRVTILDDTDGDGVADRAKDFVSGLNLATGLAFGRGGVFLLQAPYLLFYPDKNRDDVPDGDPEVLLSGFGMDDAHSVANSLTWGPDGWLYGLQGSTVTANVRGVTFQQGVWRYHPSTRRFELFCEGGGNMWGLDFDRHGRLLASTNVGGHAALHAVQGAWCWKSFGKHGPLHNPFAYGFFDHAAHEGSAREGHVTVGGLFYEADRLPERFRGKFIAGDLLGHAVRWYDVSPQGSTVKTKLEGDLLVANDAWFATTDLTLGPDGAVYVADWHDRRTAHPDPDADWDRSNGRIYAVHAEGDRPPRPIDLASQTWEQLFALLRSRNDWFVRRARRLLAERREPAAIEALRRTALRPDGEPRPIDAVWTLAAAGVLDRDLALALLKHPDDDVRTWTVRLIGDDPALSRGLGRRLVALARTEPAVAVRAQLASTARRLEPADALDIAEAILARDLDGGDPHVPLLLWWAVEPHAAARPTLAVDRLADKSSWTSAMNRDAILPRLARRLVAEGSEPADLASARLVALFPRDLFDDRPISSALIEGLRERRGSWDTARKVLGPPLDKLWEEFPEDMRYSSLAARLGSAAARGMTEMDAEDRDAPPLRRTESLRLLAELPPNARSKSLFLRVAVGDDLPEVQEAALRALGKAADDDAADALVAAYPAKPEPWRASARMLLLGRKTFAARFLAAVDRGAIAAKDISVDDLRPVALHRDPALDALVRKHWGAVSTGTPGEKLAEVRRLGNDLRAGAGDPARGRRVFETHCASCHTLFGLGKSVGPDLTHANRGDRDFLLVSLVDPSAVVRKEYQSSVVATKDGRVLTGIVDESDPGHVVVLAAGGEKTVVPRAEVESVESSSVSLMPENLYRQLSPGDLRDLFSFLAGSKP